MKTRQLHFLYVGLATGQVATKRRKTVQLEIRKLQEALPYAEGSVEIHYVLFPEYTGCVRLTKKKREWKQREMQKALQGVKEAKWTAAWCEPETVQDQQGNETAGANFDAIIYSQEFLHKMPLPEEDKRKTELPLELFMVELYRCKPFRGICISLPEEEGNEETEETEEAVMKLIRPYAPRLGQIYWIGKEGKSAEILGEMLFEEYGFIMEAISRPPASTVWLDLRNEDINIFHMTFCQIKRIDRLQTLKFLDTTAKNGYNTEVN